MEVIEKLCRGYNDSHPDSVAMVLESVSSAERAEYLRGVSPGSAAWILELMSPEASRGGLEHLSNEEIAPILDEMTLSGGAALLRRLPNESRTHLLESIEEERRTDLARMLHFPERTCGAVMDPNYPALPVDHKIDDLVSLFRRIKGTAYDCVLILNRGHLPVGAARARDALQSDSDTTLASVMLPCLFRIPARADALSIADNADLKRFQALPVVDDGNRYIGAVCQPVVERMSRQSVTTDDSQRVKRTGMALAEIYRLGLSGLMDSLDVSRSGVLGDERRTEVER